MVAFGVGQPLRTELVVANIDLLAASCAGVFIFALAYHKTWLAGAALGLALAFKPTAGMLLLVPLITGQASVALVAVVVVGLLNLVGFLLIPESSRFFTSALPYLVEGNTLGFNISLKASLDRLSLPGVMVDVARTGVAVFFIGLVFRYRWRLRSEPALVALLVVLFTPLLTSYYFDRYLVYLVVGTAAITVFSGRLEIATAAAGLFILMSDFISRSRHDGLDAILGLRYVVGVALVIFAISHYLERHHEASRPTPRPA